LEGLDGEEQQQVADELRDLLAGVADGRTAAVGQDGVAVAGDVGIHAEGGSAAAWQMGDVQIGYSPGGSARSAGASADPHQPGRSRG
jgi:hypothetical protein